MENPLYTTTTNSCLCRSIFVSLCRFCFSILRRRNARPALIIFQLIVFSQFATHQTPLVRAASEINLEAKYNVQVRDGGLVITSTTINLINDAVAPLTSLKIGFPESFAKSFDGGTASDSQGRELNLSSESALGGIFWLNVELAESVAQGQTLSLSISLAFSGLVTFHSVGSSTVYVATFPGSPALPFDVARCEVEVTLPSGAVAQTSSLSNLLTEVYAPLKANSNNAGFVTFAGNMRVLECSRVSREVAVNPLGSIYFYDSYTIQNLGKASLQSITLRLPPDAEDVAAYDAGGQLPITLSDVTDAEEAAVSFRYPLRGQVDSASFNDVGVFTIGYRVSSRSYVASTGSWLGYRLSINQPSVSLDFTVRSLTVKVVLPEGAKYQSSSLSGTVSTSGVTSSVAYAFSNVTPLSFPSIKIDYEYLVLWAALRPALWIVGIAAVIGAVTLYRRREKRLVPAAPGKRQRLIASFTEAYDERTMLLSELDSLDGDFDERRMGRRDYNRRKTIIQQRLRALDVNLSGLKSGIRQAEPRYAERVDRLTRAEAEAASLRSNLENLRVQYHSGKMSRRAFMALKDEHDKKMGRVKRIIEGIIIEFRGEIA